MNDFKSMLKGAKLHRRSVPICLRGDLVAQFEELERQLAAASQAILPAPSIEDGSPGIELAQQIEALRAEMQANSYTFVIEALPGPKFRELKAQHPPRHDAEENVIVEDQILDANYDTFLEPLLRACLVDPALDDATWAETNEKLSDNQYNQLVTAAVYVNKGAVSIPFSRAASSLLQSSDSA